MLVRRHINDAQKILALLPGCFEKVEVDVNGPSSPAFDFVADQEHRLTLRYGDEAHGGTIQFYILNQLLVDDIDDHINPLWSIKSDALVHDLRLDQELPEGTDVRFLFVHAGQDTETTGLVYSTEKSFCVVDRIEKVAAIQFILALCQHKQKPDNWHGEYPGWTQHIYGTRPCPTLYPLIYDYIDFQDHAGGYWSLLCYRLGARTPEFGAGGKLLWQEEGQTYADFDSFVSARRDYARTLCTRLLERYKRGHDTNVPLNDLLTFNDRCDLLNARIATLRTYEGLQNLESYVVTDRLTQQYLTLPASSNAVYTMAQAERRIAQFERLVKLRDTYEECYKMLEPDIKAVCGHLSTTNVRFAEIEVPARHSLPGEKIMETHQFGYTPQGLREADTWLTKERAAFDEGCVFIQQRFGLQLQDDGTLQPIPGEAPKE